MAGVYNGCRGYAYPEIYADKQKEHVVLRWRAAVHIRVGANNVGKFLKRTILSSFLRFWCSCICAETFKK